MKSNRPKLRLAIFFSGWGRSTNKCLDLLQEESLIPVEFVCAVTVGQSSEVINRIKTLGVVVISEDPRPFKSLKDYQKQLAKKLWELKIDYIFMLGYKYRIREPLLNLFPNRILNIHPSLLPSFKNTQSAVQDAMAFGVKITGITTHIIDEKIDEGTILCQVAIPITEQDDYLSMDEKFMIECRNILEETITLVCRIHQPGRYLNSLLE